MNTKEIFPFDKLPIPIHEFIKTCSNYTESPDEYLACGALAVASTLAGPHYKINNQALNNYFLIVGRTGVARKTTAANYALKLFDGVINNRPETKFNKSINEETEEQIKELDAYEKVTHFTSEGMQEKKLGIGTSTLLRVNEYASVFEVSQRIGQRNTISELTSMYDGVPINVALVSRDLSIQDYSLSILATSTPNWLKGFCSSQQIGGGFVNRHLIFTGLSKRNLPFVEKINKEEWNKLLNLFQGIIPQGIHCSIQENNKTNWKSNICHIDWSSPAKKLWVEYYEFRNGELNIIESDLLRDLAARELTHATKLAGLKAILEGRNEVTDIDLKFGIRLARWSVRNCIDLVGVNPEFDYGSNLNKAAQKVISVISESLAITKTDLARKIGGKQNLINRAISNLEKDEFILKNEFGEYVIGNSLNSQHSEVSDFFGKTNI